MATANCTGGPQRRGAVMISVALLSPKSENAHAPTRRMKNSGLGASTAKGRGHVPTRPTTEERQDPPAEV